MRGSPILIAYALAAALAATQQPRAEYAEIKSKRPTTKNQKKAARRKGRKR